MRDHPDAAVIPESVTYLLILSQSGAVPAGVIAGYMRAAAVCRADELRVVGRSFDAFLRGPSQNAPERVGGVLLLGAPVVVVESIRQWRVPYLPVPTSDFDVVELVSRDWISHECIPMLQSSERRRDGRAAAEQLRQFSTRAWQRLDETTQRVIAEGVGVPLRTLAACLESNDAYASLPTGTCSRLREALGVWDRDTRALVEAPGFTPIELAEFHLARASGGWSASESIEALYRAASRKRELLVARPDAFVAARDEYSVFNDYARWLDLMMED